MDTTKFPKNSGLRPMGIKKWGGNSKDKEAEKGGFAKTDFKKPADYTSPSQG